MDNIEISFDDTFVVPPVDTPTTPEPQEPAVDEPTVDIADESSVDSDALLAHYDFLTSVGILQEEEEFEPTMENFTKVVDKTKASLREEAYQTIVSSLPPDFLPMLEFAMTSPQASIQDYLNLEATNVDLSSLDLTKTEDQKLAIRMYYEQTSSHPSDRIDRMIARLEDDELGAEAADAVVALKAHLDQQKEALVAKAKADEAALKAKQEQQQQEITTQVDKLITGPRAKQVQNFILAPIKAEDKITTRLNYTLQNIFKNPAHLVQLTDLLLDYDQNKGLTSTRLEQKVASNTANNLRKLVDEKLASAKLKTKQAATAPKTNVNLEQWLKGFDQ